MEIDFQLIVPPSDEALYSAWNSALNERLPAPLRKRFRFVRARLDGKLLPPETKFDVIVSPANSYGRLGTLTFVPWFFFFGFFFRPKQW